MCFSMWADCAVAAMPQESRQEVGESAVCVCALKTSVRACRTDCEPVLALLTHWHRRDECRGEPAVLCAWREGGARVWMQARKQEEGVCLNTGAAGC